MKKLIFVLFSLGLLSTVLIQCTSSATKTDQATAESVPNEVVIPEDFVDFYEQFHSDSLFQLEHILFPLKGKSETSDWQEAGWQLHKPFDNSSGEFVQDFENFGGILIETIQHRGGMFYMIRRFAKLTNGWNLIYYETRDITDNSDEFEDHLIEENEG